MKKGCSYGVDDAHANNSNDMNPKVSIIVPIYGIGKEMLDRCVDSLVRQTLQEVEIILVDDGNHGCLPELCDVWAKKDNRIKVIHKKNEGLGLARNSGLEKATGEYVAFVDSDDHVALETYEIAYEEAQTENADAVFFGIKIEYRKNRWSFKGVKEKRIWEEEQITCYMLDMIASAPYEKEERKWGMSAWHAVYRRSIIDKNNVRFPSEREVVSEDLHFHVNFLKSAQKISYIPQVLYYYCMNTASITSTFRTEAFDGFLRLHGLLIGMTDKIEGGKERVDRLFIGYVRTYISALVMSESDRKGEILENVLDNGIWNELRLRYDPAWLPPYQSVFYRLILGKHSRLLVCYAYLGRMIRHHFVKKRD